MPLKGIIRTDGTLMPTVEVLEEAAFYGHVDGYPLAVLAKLLEVWKSRGPSASSIASSTWRRMVLERIVDYYAPPRSRMALLRGSLIHNGLERIKLPRMEVMKERQLRSPLPSRKDIVLSGKIDVYFPKQHRLEDYKTCARVPDLIKPDHIFQLAVYSWLLKWANYDVQHVAIDYIAWDDMRQCTEVEDDDGEVILADDHPLVTDEACFECAAIEGWEILNDGFTNCVVPSMQDCVRAYCRYCPLKWACDRIAVRGEQIDPEDFDQEEYT